MIGTQLTLEPLARLSDPSTSHEAAARIAPQAPTHRERALAALRTFGPLTDFELAARTGLAQTSVGVRRKELRDAGLVAPLTDEEGRPVRRPSPSGSPSIVWRAL